MGRIDDKGESYKENRNYKETIANNQKKNYFGHEEGTFYRMHWR